MSSAKINNSAVTIQTALIFLASGGSSEVSAGRFDGTEDGNGEGDFDRNLGERRTSELAAEDERDLVIIWGTSGRRGPEGLEVVPVDTSGTKRCEEGVAVSCDVAGVGGCIVTAGGAGGAMSDWSA
jgi:hypothetical protein